MTVKTINSRANRTPWPHDVNRFVCLNRTALTFVFSVTIGRLARHHKKGGPASRTAPTGRTIAALILIRSGPGPGHHHPGRPSRSIPCPAFRPIRQSSRPRSTIFTLSCPLSTAPCHPRAGNLPLSCPFILIMATQYSSARMPRHRQRRPGPRLSMADYPGRQTRPWPWPGQPWPPR